MRANKIIKLITEDNLSSAFNEIHEVIKDKELKLEEDYIVICNNYNELISQYKRGVLAYHDYQLKKNRILESLIYLVNKIELLIESGLSENADYYSQVIKITKEYGNNFFAEKEKSIFVFGEFAAGKTAFIYSIAEFFSSSNKYNFAFSPNNKEEVLMWNRVVSDMNHVNIHDSYGNFVDRTPLGTLLRLKLAFQIGNDKPEILNFIESSGEDLKWMVSEMEELIGSRKTSDTERENIDGDETGIIDELPSINTKDYSRDNHLNNLISEAIEADFILLIVDANQNYCDEQHYHFLKFLTSKKESIKVGIIFTKWDIMPNTNVSLGFVLYSVLPKTVSLILESENIIDNMAFSYSIIDNIKRRKYASAENIVNWLSG